MGACLSCLGLSRSPSSDPDRQRLLYEDYQPTSTQYGTWGAHAIPPENVMSAEEIRREQEEFNRITQRASDHIVEIFPHQQPQHQTQCLRTLTSPPPQNNHFDSPLSNGTDPSHSDLQMQLQGQSYTDILLSLIPGDKSKRSIRIYPASRPSSSARDAASVRSKGSSSRLNGAGASSDAVREKGRGVFVKLNVDLP